MYIGLVTKSTTHFPLKQDRLLQDIDNLLDSDYWRDPRQRAAVSFYLRRWGKVHEHNLALANQPPSPPTDPLPESVRLDL